MENLKTASFTKSNSTLKAEDKWGLRIEGQGAVQVGEIVLAKRLGDKFGTRKQVTEILWSGNGIYVCRMGNAPKAAKKAPKAEKSTPAFQPDLVDEFRNDYNVELCAELEAERIAAVGTADDLPF